MSLQSRARRGALRFQEISKEGRKPYFAMYNMITIVGSLYRVILYTRCPLYVRRVLTYIVERRFPTLAACSLPPRN